MFESTTEPASAVSALPARRSWSAIGPWQWLVLTIVAVEGAVLFWPTAHWLYERWTLSVWQHAHGLLIPPAVAYFAYEALKPLRGLPASANGWGFVLLVPALFLHALDAGMHTQLLSAVALIVALNGLALILMGTARWRAIAFPLAFLFFALPIPLAFTEPIHWQLRQIMTAGAVTALPWFGVPVFVEGTTLQLSGGAVEIADACSGFSTLYAAMTVAALCAYSVRSLPRRLAVLVCAAPIAVLANLLRVTALVLLVAWRGQAVLDTFIHPLSGMLTFALALPVIFWIGTDTQPAEPAPPEPAQ
jgi:exosortase